MLLLIACAGGPSIPKASADEGAKAPIDAWLANTEWACVAVTSLGATRYEVAHRWSFTDTLYTTDLPDRVANEANSGALPYYGAYAFNGWVWPVDEDTWEPGILTTNRHWFGVSDRAALLEYSVNTNDANPILFYFDRFDGTDGMRHLAIAGGGSNANAIDCVQDG